MYLLNYIRRDVFPSLQSLSRLPVMCITSWLNAYSMIKMFPFSSTIVDRFYGLAGSFSFCPQHKSPTDREKSSDYSLPIFSLRRRTFREAKLSLEDPLVSARV